MAQHDYNFPEGAKKPPPKFEVRDVIHLRAGSKLQRVLERTWCGTYRESRQLVCRKGFSSHGWHYRIVYLSNEHYTITRGRWRHEEDLVGVERPEPPTPTKPKKVTTMLYQTLEKKPRFGTFLTKNSTGQMVLEMKGTGGSVESFNEDDIERVMPYTVELKTVGSVGSGSSYHRVMEKGSVEVGDLLISIKSGKFYRVTAVDTKSEGAVDFPGVYKKLEASTVKAGS